MRQPKTGGEGGKKRARCSPVLVVEGDCGRRNVKHGDVNNEPLMSAKERAGTHA